MKYRKLKVGEIWRKSDECRWNCNERWIPARSDLVGNRILFVWEGDARRPLKQRKRSQQQTTTKVSRKAKLPKR